MYKELQVLPCVKDMGSEMFNMIHLTTLSFAWMLYIIHDGRIWTYSRWKCRDQLFDAALYRITDTKSLWYEELFIMAVSLTYTQNMVRAYKIQKTGDAQVCFDVCRE